MIRYKEIIRKSRDYGKVYYFNANNFSAQEEKIEKLVKDINKIEVMSSIEECYAFKFEKFKLVVLKNAEKITKTSRFLFFFNEKIKDHDIEKKWSKFKQEEKKNLIECRIYSSFKTPWQLIKELTIKYKKNILKISPLIYLLIIFLWSALLGPKFLPLLIANLVFLIIWGPLLFAVYKIYKGYEKKWRIISVLYNILNIGLGLTALGISKLVYRILAGQ